MRSSTYTWYVIPFKPDLTFMDEIVESENIDVITVVTPSNVKKVESNHKSVDVKNNGDVVEPKTVRKNSFRPPVIEDWNSDDDSEVEFIPNVKDKTVRPSTKKIKFVKSARETVENVETPKQNKHYPIGNQRNWNNLMSQRLGSDFKMINKACFVCGSFEHLHYVCDKKVIRPVWNNSSRVNHKNFPNKMTHPHPNRKFIPQAVLIRSGKINTTGASVNTVVTPVNTAGSKPTIQDYIAMDPQKRLISYFNVHATPNSRRRYKVKVLMTLVTLRHMIGNNGYLRNMKIMKVVMFPWKVKVEFLEKELEITLTYRSGRSGASDKMRRRSSHNNTPVSTVGSSFTNDALSSPVNDARTFEEHLFEQFSPFKNAFSLPDVPNVFSIDDTGIFANAYDDEDVGAAADLNNLETTMNVSPIPTTRIDKDHPKDHIIGDLTSAI
ncbi:hypothetical protein Tco_0475930 [Tanacetum coccineum]